MEADSWSELHHVSLEYYTDTTADHLFCFTFGSLCAIEQWAETETVCDDCGSPEKWVDVSPLTIHFLQVFVFIFKTLP